MIEKKRNENLDEKQTAPGKLFASLAGPDPTQLLVIGRNGTAKTELMKSLALHEIRNGEHCVVIVDTRGELSNLVVSEVKDDIEISSRLFVIDPMVLQESLGLITINNEPDALRKSEALVDAFRLIHQNQIRSLEISHSPGWISYTDTILQSSLLVLMFTRTSLQNLLWFFADVDFRDLLLAKLDRSNEISPELRNTLRDDWATYKRLSRTDHWFHTIEPLLGVLKLLRRPDLSPMSKALRRSDNDIVPVNVLPLDRPVPSETVAANFAKREGAVPSIITDAIKKSLLSATSPLQEVSSPVEERENVQTILDLEKLLESKKIVIFNLTLPGWSLDSSYVTEAVASLFITSLISSARSLCDSASKDFTCVIFSDSLDAVVSPQAIHRICRDRDKYRVSLRLCANTLPSAKQASVDKLIDHMGNLAVFAVSRSEAELLGSEMFRHNSPENARKLMKQAPRSYWYYQAKTGKLVRKVQLPN